MPLDQNQAELDYALAQQRDDAYRHAQLLRDFIGVAADVARALQQQAISAATDIPITGGQPRGADLTPSFERLSRAARRNAMLVRKLNADIVAHCQGAPTLYPLPPDPAAPAAAPEPVASPQVPTPTDRPDEPRRERLDNDRADPIDDEPDGIGGAAAADDALDDHDHDDDAHDDDDHDDEEPDETLPDAPIAALIAESQRDLTIADPRQPNPARRTAPSTEHAPDEDPPPPSGPWTYQRPPPEPPIPGLFSLDDLRRLPPPSG